MQARSSSIWGGFGKAHAQALVEEQRKAKEAEATKWLDESRGRHLLRPPERATAVKREHLLPESVRFLERFERVASVGLQDRSLQAGPINMMFEGSDGTGKGETARQVSEVLWNNGYFYRSPDDGDEVRVLPGLDLTHGGVQHSVPKPLLRQRCTVVGREEVEDGQEPLLWVALGDGDSDRVLVRARRLAPAMAPLPVIATFDAEHLVHLYTRQEMLPMLQSIQGYCIFINHADRLVAEGADPMFRLAFTAVMEEIRMLSLAGTVCILGVGRGGRARIERRFPASTALFNFHLRLPDWSSRQLAKLSGHIAEQHGFQPQDAAMEGKLASLLEMTATASDSRRSNALLARQLVAQAVQQRTLRIADQMQNLNDHQAASLTSGDFETAAASMLPSVPSTLRTSSEVLADLDGLVGRSSVKQYLHELEAMVKVHAARMEMGLPTTAATSHLVFKGNPGTGESPPRATHGTIPLILRHRQNCGGQNDGRDSARPGAAQARSGHHLHAS